jgi:hypothetical protein
MEDFVTIRIPRDDVGQIIDGLTERMIIWRTTEEYLEVGYSQLGDFIEECSDPEEARFIADYYEKIIEFLKKQLEEQKA